jgi:uncharacterized membrane protein
MGRIEHSVEVNASTSDCYKIWSNFPQFPRFMENVEEVRAVGNNLWHWKVKGPLGKSAEWDAVCDVMEENRVISWHSVENSEVDNSGHVTFESVSPGRTRVTASIAYAPPGGAIGEAVAALFQNPDQMVQDDLHRFKMLVEGSEYPGGYSSGPTVESTSGPVGAGVRREGDLS